MPQPQPAIASALRPTWSASREYRREGVRVGPSTHGLGVFSLRTFHVRERVGPIRGTLMEDPDYGSDYCMEIGRHSALEPDPPFRYVNHSCHPNCLLLEVQTECPDGAAEFCVLWLEVLLDIAPGEQITIDYRWPAWAAIPCCCGAPDCRGWIVAAEERDHVDPQTARQADPLTP